MTLLYQKQRHKDEQGRFIADYIDYAIVYQLLEESFAESLGDVRRYTDDRIRIIENAGMMTPRDLAGRIGVSTAAISQWSKGMIDKGVLNWCDESGAQFDSTDSLEQAKRVGKAYLFLAGRKSLSSPFQLTGDPRWDNGGELWTTYDLVLGESADVSDQASTTTEKIISETVERCHSNDNQAPVKALSRKTNDEIKKMFRTIRETQSPGDAENFVGDQLFQEFNEILSSEGVGAIN